MSPARAQTGVPPSTGRAIDRAVAPLVSEPGAAGVLLDVDGTLAPITRQPTDARVPDGVQRQVAALCRRYALVACISGRTALEARRLVGVGAATYVGNHGFELLRPGGRPEPVPELEPVQGIAPEFARGLDSHLLRRHQIRVEDKGPIVALHWRGSADPGESRRALEQVAAEAEAAGLAPHWGRLVLELRPPVDADKGTAVEELVTTASLRHALYAGDDVTDVYAFRRLEELQAHGRLETAVRVGVASEEGPPQITAEADLVVEGIQGVARLLDALLA